MSVASTGDGERGRAVAARGSYGASFKGPAQGKGATAASCWADRWTGLGVSGIGLSAAAMNGARVLGWALRAIGLFLMRAPEMRALHRHLLGSPRGSLGTDRFAAGIAAEMPDAQRTTHI